MEKNKHVTVFGATGQTGIDLVRLLSQAGIETVAITRNISNTIEFPFIKWSQADMADKRSLYSALQNSTSVFLLSGNSPNVVTEQGNVINVAKELGVKHMVKLSSGAADKNSPFLIPRAHGEVEELLMSSGIRWTMLRPNGIMQNWLGDIAESVRKERKFYEATANGKRAHVDRRDVAEIAFKCLTEPESHYDKIYLLTSDRAVNYTQVAEAISKAIGERVEYVSISLEKAKQKMEQEGMPRPLVETFIFYDRTQRNGQAAIVSDSVRTILGKPARTLEDFAGDYADRFM